jgi:hypothetical protein
MMAMFSEKSMELSKAGAVCLMTTTSGGEDIITVALDSNGEWLPGDEGGMDLSLLACTGRG